MTTQLTRLAPHDRHIPPSPAELPVLAGIARGHDRVTIAATIGRTVNTVSTHTERMRVRYDVHNGAALVALGYRYGWLTGLPAEPRPHIHLPPRLAEILELVAEGRSNREIGKALHISLDTVGTYMTRLMLTLGAANRAHTVAIAFQTGLLRIRAAGGPARAAA